MNGSDRQIGVALLGAHGRMGQRIATIIARSQDMKLVAAIDRSMVESDLPDRPDVLIDFSTPAATTRWAEVCARLRVPMIIGTTGLDDGAQRAIDDAAHHVPIFESANMSVGANLLMRLAAQAAGAMGADLDVEIVESHHRHKRDAPSGTARAIADAIEQSPLRRRPTIHSTRLGEEIGRHTVYLATAWERLELTHVATDRDVFADGAVRAAGWIIGKAPGRYGMTDLLDSYVANQQ